MLKQLKNNYRKNAKCSFAQNDFFHAFSILHAERNRRIRSTTVLRRTCDLKHHTVIQGHNKFVYNNTIHIAMHN